MEPVTAERDAKLLQNTDYRLSRDFHGYELLLLRRLQSDPVICIEWREKLRQKILDEDYELGVSDSFSFCWSVKCDKTVDVLIAVPCCCSFFPSNSTWSLLSLKDHGHLSHCRSSYVCMFIPPTSGAVECLKEVIDLGILPSMIMVIIWYVIDNDSGILSRDPEGVFLYLYEPL